MLMIHLHMMQQYEQSYVISEHNFKTAIIWLSCYFYSCDGLCSVLMVAYLVAASNQNQGYESCAVEILFIFDWLTLV